MRLAVMQPYAFPYLGYFQLIAAVDRFVLLDDVNFITRGWIHRNCILSPDGPVTFTIPLRKASSNRLICDHEIVIEDRNWKKFPRLVRQSYSRAPMFDAVWPLIDEILQAGESDLAAFNRLSLKAILDYLGISTPLVDSSRAYGNRDLKGSGRLVDICRREGADEYVNPEGGRDLYSARDFAGHGIELEFLIHEPAPYPQFGQPFVERLSIIDALMFNSREALQRLLASCRVEKASPAESLPEEAD